MSLTSTLTSPELPQTSLIPSGYFVELPDFASKVQELVDLFNPNEKEKLSQDQNKIQKQKTHLTTLIEELKLSQKEYDFYDYEQRLLLSDAEIENILETEIFRKDGVITELGKSFYEYLELLTAGKSEQLKGKMKRKLIKELKLEDRVYEKDRLVLEGNGKVGRIKFENKEQFFQDIKQFGFHGIKGLYLGCNGLGLSKTLEVPDFINLVKQAGESRIKGLYLGNNNLSDKLDALDFLELVKQAGESGIRSLSLLGNELSKKLDASDFLELVKQAGESGIRGLNFSDNRLLEKLDTSDFLELVKQSGFHGIKSLNLGNDNLYEKFDVPDFIELVKQSGFHGIKSLNLSINGFSIKLNYSQKQEIDNIAKQYNMKLNYSE